MSYDYFPFSSEFQMLSGFAQVFRSLDCLSDQLIY